MAAAPDASTDAPAGAPAEAAPDASGTPPEPLPAQDGSGVPLLAPDAGSGDAGSTGP